MVIRMLGPAGPVTQHRRASFGASVRQAPPDDIRTVWDWGDGQLERVRQRWARVARVRRAHRYDSGGLYRLVVKGSLGAAPDASGTRYVAVRRQDQLAASGWIRDPSVPPVPFGFVISPPVGGTDGSIELRCLFGDDELVARDLGWLMMGDGEALHFGGGATLAGTQGMRFRVDVGRERPEDARSASQVTISVYAAGTTPGRDAPVRRVSGPLRPGRVVLRTASRP
jgi:hypothetical protein